MFLIGTIINIIAVLVGSGIGILAGNRLPESIQRSIMSGLGLVVIVIALQNALQTGNIIIPLISLVLGIIIGELLDIEGAFKRLGGWLQHKFAGVEGDSPDAEAQARIRFINGFVTASLVFCVGPLTVIGSIQNGLNGDIKLIAIKSALDFFASMAFASSLGIGVAFASLSVLVIQGGFALFGVIMASAVAGSAGNIAASPYIREMTATGGLLMLGIALILLDIKPLRVANYLPALVIALLIVGLASLLHVPIYPIP